MERSLPGSSVHGIARVGHDLATKPPPPVFLWVFYTFIKTHKLHILNVCEYIGGI